MQGNPLPPIRTVTGPTGDSLLQVPDLTGAQPISEKDQPDGYPGLNVVGELEGPISLRKDTAANLAGVTLSSGKIAFETDLERLLAGDGSAAGGLDAAWGSGGTVAPRPTEDHADDASKLTQACNVAKTLTPGAKRARGQQPCGAPAAAWHLRLRRGGYGLTEADLALGSQA